MLDDLVDIAVDEGMSQATGEPFGEDNRSVKTRLLETLQRNIVGLFNGIVLISLIIGILIEVYLLGLAVAGCILILVGFIPGIKYVPFMSRSIRLDTTLRKVAVVTMGVCCIVLAVVFQILWGSELFSSVASDINYAVPFK